MFAYLFSFEGRAGRATYIWQSIWSAVIGIVVLVAVPLMSLQFGPAALALAMCGILISCILLMWNSLAVTVRRLHDLGKPGWHCLLMSVPYYNLYLGLLLIFKPGEEHANLYGLNPLNPHRTLTHTLLERALDCESRGDWAGAFALYRRVYEEEFGNAESHYARECIARMHQRMQLAI